MDNEKEIKEGLDEGNAKGYVKAIVWILITGIVFIAAQFVYLNNQKAQELAQLHLYYLDREDQRRKEYQSVIDREREGHIQQINALNAKVDKIQSNSDVNGRLAEENAANVERNRKYISDSYKKIKRK